VENAGRKLLHKQRVTGEEGECLHTELELFRNTNMHVLERSSNTNINTHQHTVFFYVISSGNNVNEYLETGKSAALYV
jgi:hypothetical protein